MRSKLAIFWLAVLFLFSGGMTIWFAVGPSRSGPAVQVNANSTSAEGADNDEPPLKEFTLTERSGKPFHSKSLDGQVWVTSFFFASCPATCMRKNWKVKELESQYGPRGVRFVSITCDPSRDTPPALARYAKTFDADPQQWLFLTGRLDYIQRIGDDIFQQTVKPQGHTEYLIVVDQQGEIRGYFDWRKPDKVIELKQMLDRLLEEKS